MSWFELKPSSRTPSSSSMVPPSDNGTKGTMLFPLAGKREINWYVLFLSGYRVVEINCNSVIINMIIYF